MSKVRSWLLWPSIPQTRIPLNSQTFDEMTVKRGVRLCCWSGELFGVVEDVNLLYKTEKKEVEPTSRLVKSVQSFQLDLMFGDDHECCDIVSNHLSCHMKCLTLTLSGDSCNVTGMCPDHSSMEEAVLSSSQGLFLSFAPSFLVDLTVSLGGKPCHLVRDVGWGKNLHRGA